MSRLKTYNNRRSLKELSPRQIEVIKAKRYVRQFRKFYPRLKVWQRRYAIEFMTGNTGTITGRITSQPEMQRYRPAPTNPYPELQRQVAYLDVDYKGIEERILSTVGRKADIHSDLAKTMFGVTNHDTRRRAKTINYMSVYGMSSDAITKKLKGK